MQDHIKRDKVRAAYDGPKWKAKVDKMSDRQIIALYFRFMKEGKIK